MPLVNGDGSLRKHPYEGFPVCPGSGYNIDRPAKAQDEALSKRVDEMFVQRKDVAR
jgi:hypothetical protein